MNAIQLMLSKLLNKKCLPELNLIGTQQLDGKPHTQREILIKFYTDIEVNTFSNEGPSNLLL